MVTIKDVAKKAGVSISTVSFVINESKYVSEELQKRVIDAIEELNYRPNQAARQLKKKKTNIIGVLLPELNNYYFSELLNGIEKHSMENDYQIFLATTHDEDEKEVRAVNSMLDYGVDGFLIATIDDDHASALDIIKNSQLPYVFLNRSPKTAESHVVQLNNRKAGEIAAYYAIEQQFQNILFVGKNRFNSLERESAFKEVLFNNKYSVQNTIYCEYSIHDAFEKLSHYLQYNTVPDFVYTATDVQAYGAILALIESGFKIPEDVRILGTDNNSFSEYFKIPLSTIDGKATYIGYRGASIMWNILNKETPYEKFSYDLIEPKIILRES